ncbi:MAG: heparan-alpha-glucosaminide N-acetyltransferase domain-containing protein [Candidatus Korobacteraceae bacterium]|jgi:predicted acyltransferase
MSTATAAVVRRAEHSRPAQGRLFSLDVFRGATIAAMIVVNNQSSDAAYWPLQHASWNGWTPTDLIFPFFLFIVGVSLVFSFDSRLERGDSRRALVLHTIRRSAILFAIGLGLNGLAALQFHTWRIPGVLQRIALVYCAAGLITLFASIRSRVAWIAGLLFGYWILMRYVPVPGYGVPGRDIPLLHSDANLAAYLDRKLLLGHLWEGTRDPEGILSTLPAIATALCGVLTGEWLRSGRSAKQKLAGMLACGLAGVIAGEVWGIWFPINKKLWTSSYVLLTAGCALICLATCYWASDIKLRRGRWSKPFLIFGMNAIAAYVISELIGGWLSWEGFTFWHSPEWMESPALASLLHSLVVLALCFLPVWWLYRRHILLRA